MKIKLILKIFLILFIQHEIIYAQEREISGTVKDDTGMPLSGVNITVKETDRGTQTDFDGKFKIKVSKGQILEFSYVGLQNKTIEVGDSKVINVTMKEGSSLNEVVVTALGIKREEKTLTSAQQTVNSEDLVRTKQPDFVNSLSGKIAGLNIQRSSSGLGGSSKVVLRGNKSISGVSTPLYVIDGIPMLNPSAGATSSKDAKLNYDNGDGLSQINPEDIESISVLKGANSAVLYGSQGANGVILIETKSGKPGKFRGSVSSTVQFSNTVNLPDLQFRYGQKDGKGIESWSYDRKDYDDKFVKNYFNTGVQTTNSLSLSGGSETSTSYFSYANTSSKGVIPKNKYLRNNLTLKHTDRFFDDQLKITSRIMLTQERTRNRPKSAANFNPVSGVYLFPRSLDFNEYKEQYEVFDENRNMMIENWYTDDGKSQNPYWIANKIRNENHRKRMIANIAVSFDLNDHINFKARGNYDYFRNKFENKAAAGTLESSVPANGRYQFSDKTDHKVYADALFNYNNDFGDFDVDINLGGSFQRTTSGDGIEADSKRNIGLKYPNVFSLQNMKDEVLIKQTKTRKEKQGVFGTASIGFKDMVFLDLSARNDWSSSLAFTSNYSYFYPAGGISVLLTEMLNLPNFINYGKMRASYSKVSTEVPAYFSHPLNSIGIDGINKNTEKPFEELKPEDQYSLEIGTTWKFFNNRLNFDLTYYKIDNKRQFIPLDAPSGSGFTKYYVNAGHIRNSGFELSLSGYPIKNEYFKWNSRINYSSNKNEILELHPDLEGRYKLSGSDGYASYITKNGHFSDIYGYGFQKDDQGRIKVDENGKPEQTSEEILVGDAEPDFLLSWNNTFTYRNWSFSFLIDSRVGGHVLSLTEGILDKFGVSERTARARDNGMVKINGVDPDGNPVTSVDPKTYYKTTGGRNGILANYAYKATNIRLRELSLGYSFNFNDSFFVTRASISFIANNLFFFYKDAPFDPDVAFSPSTNSYQGFAYLNPPSTRQYGINLKFNF